MIFPLAMKDPHTKDTASKPHRAVSHLEGQPCPTGARLVTKDLTMASSTTAGEGAFKYYISKFS